MKRKRLEHALTRRQRDVLRAFIDLWEAQGRPPSQQEVGEVLGITSNSVIPHVKALEAKGYLRKEAGRSRSVVPTHDEEGFSLERPGLASPKVEHPKEPLERIPILGEIAAGLPLEANENVLGEMLINRSMLVGAPRGRRVFALRVRGESMIGDGIMPGDLIFVVPQHTARDGQIVVALIDGEATVKHLHRKDDVIVLAPSNPKCPTIIITPSDGHDLRILGVVIGVYRAFDGALPG